MAKQRIENEFPFPVDLNGQIQPEPVEPFKAEHTHGNRQNFCTIWISDIHRGT